MFTIVFENIRNRLSSFEYTETVRKNNFNTVKETFVEHGDQFYHIISSVITKLSQMIQLEDSAQHKVILPYLHSLGNMIGLSPDVALTACDIDFLPTIFSCLKSNTDFIQKEALWILVNFMAEPSCRVLVMCQPQLLNVTFQLCQSTDESLVVNALYLLDASSKVSSWMCQYLVEHKAVSLLVQLLANPKLKVLEAALGILVDLVSGTEQGMMALLAADGLAQLQAVALKESIPHVKEIISKLFGLCRHKKLHEYAFYFSSFNFVVSVEV